MPQTDWWVLFKTTRHPSFPVPEAGFGSFDSFGTGATHENDPHEALLVDHSNGNDRATILSPEEETGHGFSTTAQGDEIGFGQDASTTYTPGQIDRDLPTPAKTVKTAK